MFLFPILNPSITVARSSLSSPGSRLECRASLHSLELAWSNFRKVKLINTIGNSKSPPFFFVIVSTSPVTGMLPNFWGWPSRMSWAFCSVLARMFAPSGNLAASHGGWSRTRRTSSWEEAIRSQIEFALNSFYLSQQQYNKFMSRSRAYHGRMGQRQNKQSVKCNGTECDVRGFRWSQFCWPHPVHQSRHPVGHRLSWRASEWSACSPIFQLIQLLFCFVELCARITLATSMLYSFLTALLIWCLLAFTSTMNTSVFVSSIFFIADSVVSGFLMMVKASSLFRLGTAFRGYFGFRGCFSVDGR